MRLVNRRLMLQMPVSTVYCEWLPNSYVELRIVTGPDEEDWMAIRLIDGVKTAFFLDPKFVKTIPRFEPELGDSRSVLYLVWEQGDIETTLGRMQAALASVPSQPAQFRGD